MAKPPVPFTASARGTTYTLNTSNHPDIGPDGLVIGEDPTPIPNATEGLLGFLRSLPGLTLTEPLALK